MSGPAVRRMSLRSPRMWIGIAVSAFFVYLVSRRIDWPSFARALIHVSPAWLGVSALLNVANYMSVGLRWRQVIATDVRISAREAYDAVVISNLATLVAPSRAGDLAKAALVSRRRGIPVSRVLGAIVVERFADVALLILLAGALSAIMPFPPAIRAGVTVFTIVGFGALTAAIAAADWLPALAGRMVGALRPSWGIQMREFLKGVFAGVRGVGRLRRFPGTLGWTAASWALSALSMWAILHAMSLPVPWYAAAFVLLVVNLGGVIPASPGSIGVYHYLAVTALAVWMVDPNAALGFAVVAHALGLVLIAILGLAGLAMEHESLFQVTA